MPKVGDILSHIIHDDVTHQVVQRFRVTQVFSTTITLTMVDVVVIQKGRDMAEHQRITTDGELDPEKLAKLLNDTATLHRARADAERRAYEYEESNYFRGKADACDEIAARIRSHLAPPKGVPHD